MTGSPSTAPSGSSRQRWLALVAVVGLVAQLVLPLVPLAPAAVAPAAAAQEEPGAAEGADPTTAGQSAETTQTAPADTTPPVVTTANVRVAADASGTAAVAYDGFVSAGDDVGVVDFACDYPSGTVFGVGDTLVTCVATDAAGNRGSGAFYVTVDPAPDTIPPTVTVPADTAVEAEAGADSVAVAFDVSAADDTDGPLAPTCDWGSGALFPVGSTRVTCVATDAAGNQGSGTFTVTVGPAPDTAAPEVTVPDDLTTEATGPEGATVGYAVTAEDGVDGAVAPACVDDRGGPVPAVAADAAFPLGTTTVTCTATDAAGNVSAPADFAVSVRPAGPPWVRSDKEDYGPGELVTLTGGNWYPGEVVTVVVNDDQGQTWSRTVEVTADAAGNLVDPFNLPEWFVATYAVSATGPLSGTARTTFTDSLQGHAVVLPGDAYRDRTQTFTFTVTNTSTAGESVRWVSIATPADYKTFVSIGTPCPSANGWTGARNGDDGCVFTTTAANALAVNASATFSVTASILAGADNINRVWSVRVSTNPGGGSSSVAPAPPGNAGALAARAWPIEVTRAVIATSAAGIGAACPAANTSAPTGSARVIVVCGRLGASGNLTLASGSSSQLTGTMIGTTGTFASGNVNSGTAEVVLANYTNTLISSSAGTGKTIVVRVGAASNRTSPVTTLTGYEAVSPIQPTALTVDAASGTYGGTVVLSATLKVGSTGVAGKTVTFRLNGTVVGSATTTAAGVATVGADLAGLNAGGYPGAVGASFAGDGTHGGSTGSAALTVAPKPATVTANDQSKTYGAADPAFDFAASGLLAGDSLAGVTCGVGGAHAAVGSYDITCAGNTNGNYAVTYAKGTLSVGRKGLTGHFAAADKTYDGDVAAAVTGRSLTGSVAGDDVRLAGGTAAFADEHVGQDKSVTLTGAGLAGAAAGNYTLEAVETATADITARELTGAFFAQSKTYDGTRDAGIFARSLDGVVAGDSVRLEGGTATFADENVGEDKTVTGTGFLLAGADAANYALASSTLTATASITARPITVTAAPQGKTYGEVDPALTYAVTGGSLVEGDGFTGALARGAGEDAGTYAIGRGTLTAGGNYDLTFEGAILTIGQRAVAVAAYPQSKLYGAADPVLSYEITDGELVGADAFTGGLVRQAGEDVGRYAIGQGTLALSGNYALTFAGADLEITPRPLTVSADAQAKTYGDADPALTYRVTGGTLVGDDAVVGELARAAGEDAGRYAIGRGSLSAGTNYNLSFVGAYLTIGKKTLAVDADDRAKVYGDANPTPTSTLRGFVAGEHPGNVAITGAPDCAIAAAAGPNVGVYSDAIACLPGDLSARNYDFAPGAKGTLTIDPRAVEVTAAAKTKVYGAEDPALTYAVTGGSLAAGDAFTGGLARAAGQDVGSYAIGQGTLALSGNYALTFVGADLTITRAALTVTADATSRPYGAANPSFTVRYAGFVYDDDAGDLGGALDFVTAATERSPVGDYAVTPGGLTSANYELAFVAGTLSVTRAPLTVEVGSASREYGLADATLTGTILGVQNDDVISAAYRTVANQGSPVGTYAITADVSSEPAATLDNYAVTVNDGTLTVTAAPLTATADDRARTYGDENPPLTGTLAGVRNGDAITAGYVTSATASSEVGTYAIVPVLDDPDGKLGNYDVTSTSGTLTVTVATLTVTADDGRREYGQADPPFTFRLSGFRNGETEEALRRAEALSGFPALGTTATVASPVGEYPITAAQNPVAADALAATNYRFDFVGGTLAVTAATLTVTADGATKTYGEANPGFTAGYEGFRNGETLATSGVTGAPALTTAATSASGVGTYAIATAIGTLAATNYRFAVADGTLTVTPRPITVAADAKGKVYGDADPALTHRITQGSLVGGDAITGALARAAGEDVGSYAIGQGSVSAGDNYAVAYVAASLTVTRATLTVTADSKSRDFGTANPVLTASFAGFKFGQTPATGGVTGAPSLTTGATASSVVGSYPIVAAVGTLAAANYGFAFANGTLTVLRTWSCRGFYAPVDMGSIVNTVKAGSTVPLKFECFVGATELTDTAIVTSLTYQRVTSSGLPEDAIEELAPTGGTTLRYSDQFIYNWSTKGLVVGQTYRVTVTLADGSTITALFKMK